MADSSSDPRALSGKPFLSSGEAVERLGISKASLYAYVSRGLIRSEPEPDAPRTRRYRADDVERLLHRQRLRSDPENSSAPALNGAAPVLESSVSMIADGRLYYRGEDAVHLAGNATFEQVMALLWRGDLDATLPAPSVHAAEARRAATRRMQLLLASLDPLNRVQTMLPALEQSEPAIHDMRPESTIRMGVDIVHLFVSALVGAEGHAGVARSHQAYWAPGRREVTNLIDAALVLSADHELNISTFTARCIASARAPLYAAIAGGLSALRGTRHGGATLQAAAMVQEISTLDKARSVLRDRIRRGDQLAGFGHRRYPEGDPRAARLLELIRDSGIAPETVELSDEICQSVGELQGLRPNLDFALVMLCRALGQSGDSAISLLALGRTAGWIAHFMEENERDQPIRPGVRFRGDGAPSSKEPS